MNASAYNTRQIQLPLTTKESAKNNTKKSPEQLEETAAQISDEAHERFMAALAEVERESKDPEMWRREWEKIDQLVQEFNRANSSSKHSE